MKWPTPRVPGLSKLPLDKQGHVAAGLLIAACGLVASGLCWWQIELPVHIAIWAPMVPVLVAAIGKELYDRTRPHNHTCDVWDAVWTAIGGLAPCLLVQLVALVIGWLA